MKYKERLAGWAREHFWLCLTYVFILQVLAMIVLLSDSGAPLLLYQGF